jgi:hypothetical protein
MATSHSKLLPSTCTLHSYSNLNAALLRRYGHTAIVAMDASALRRVRGKTRVLLTRFLARALLCPVYTREWLDARPKGVLHAIISLFTEHAP